MSSEELLDAAVGAEAEAIVTGVQGADDLSEAADTMEAAKDVAAVSAVAEAAGVADLTRAADAEIVAGRMAQLSEVVAAAGITDVAEGANLLAASDDIAAMSINYIFFSLRKHGDLRDEYEALYQTFMNHYLTQTGDREIQETLPLFYTFRCLVVASPLWYPTLTPKTRRQLLNLAHNTLDEKHFNPKKVNSYIQ